jgi:transposase
MVQISYTPSQRNRLVGYLADGCLSQNNNVAKNAIRPYVVGWKNWLFGGTLERDAVSALFYSLIATA